MDEKKRANRGEERWGKVRKKVEPKVLIEKFQLGIHLPIGIEVPMRQLLEEYLDLIDDVVDELGSREEINYLRRLMDEGTGADRQLRVWRETGNLVKVVDYIVSETKCEVGEPGPMEAL